MEHEEILLLDNKVERLLSNNGIKGFRISCDSDYVTISFCQNELQSMKCKNLLKDLLGHDIDIGRIQSQRFINFFEKYPLPQLSPNNRVIF